MQLLRFHIFHDFRRREHSEHQGLPEGHFRRNSLPGSQKSHILSATLNRTGVTSVSDPGVSPTKRRLVNSTPIRLGSALVRTLNRVAHLRLFPETIAPSDEFFGNKAAESCYLFIQKTLGCEDTDTLAAAFGNPPLPLFILQILGVSQAPDFLVEMVMLLVHRYYLLCGVDSRTKTTKFSGHLIFVCAYLTAAQTHFGPDSFESIVRYCKEQTNYSEQHLIDIQRYFQVKVVNLCPISIMEERTLAPFFRYFRLVNDSAKWSPTSPTKT